MRTPSLTWHPTEPTLVLTGEHGVRRWTRVGTSPLPGLPDSTRYRHAAFSPDGQTLWLSPTAHEDSFELSDSVHLLAGDGRVDPRWDTGIVRHPGSDELVSTLRSDQGATVCVFARVDTTIGPARVQMLQRGIVLDADGYETPVISPDGRFMAFRGNAYENSLDVFEFPSLDRVAGVTLGDPFPSGAVTPEWREQYRSWSRHNLAFGPRTGALLVGTPRGTVVELDLDAGDGVEHEILDGEGVTAVAALATGKVVVAGAAGSLVVTQGLDAGTATLRGVAAERAAAILARTPGAATDAEWDLDLSDGSTTWTPVDLARVTPETAADGPSWLRLTAPMNKHCDPR